MITEVGKLLMLQFRVSLAEGERCLQALSLDLGLYR